MRIHIWPIAPNESVTAPLDLYSWRMIETFSKLNQWMSSVGSQIVWLSFFQCIHIHLYLKENWKNVIQVSDVSMPLFCNSILKVDQKCHTCVDVCILFY